MVIRSGFFLLLHFIFTIFYSKFTFLVEIFSNVGYMMMGPTVNQLQYFVFIALFSIKIIWYSVHS